MHALIIEIANTCSADCGRSPKPQISNGALTCTKALLLHYVFFFMCFPFFLTFCSCSPEQPGYNPSRFGAKQKTRITTANCFHDLGMPPLEKASRKAPPNKLGLPSLPLQGRRNTKRDKDTNLPRIFGGVDRPPDAGNRVRLAFCASELKLTESLQSRDDAPSLEARSTWHNPKAADAACPELFRKEYNCRGSGPGCAMGSIMRLFGACSLAAQHSWRMLRLVQHLQGSDAQISVRLLAKQVSSDLWGATNEFLQLRLGIGSREEHYVVACSLRRPSRCMWWVPATLECTTYNLAGGPVLWVCCPGQGAGAITVCGRSHQGAFARGVAATVGAPPCGPTSSPVCMTSSPSS